MQSFFEEEGIGSIEPNQCEVTYVNHVELDSEAEQGSELSRIFTFFGNFDGERGGSMASLPSFEDGGFALRYVFRDPTDDEPRGRVHVEVQPAVMGEGQRIIRLSLTARGGLTAPTFQGVADVLDTGRDAVVRTFTGITTDEMHKKWGRIK